MAKLPCMMWWEGAPCEVYMTYKEYVFVFYNGDGVGRPAVLEKSEITDVSADSRRAYVGMRPEFAMGRSLLMATLFGGLAGAAEMVATTKERPAFEQKWFFTIQSSDGGIIELEFDRQHEYAGAFFKQGVATFLRDFKKNRALYADHAE